MGGVHNIAAIHHQLHQQQTQPQHAIYHRPRIMGAALIIEATKPFHQKLIDEAKTSLNADQYEIAVVLSQAAVEMCTECALTALFTVREGKALVDPILDLFQAKDVCSYKLVPQSRYADVLAFLDDWANA